MNIHFSNVDFSSSTGPNTFANRLANELSIRGYNIVDSKSDYDIFLCFIEPSTVPKNNAKIVQRLDGIWFKPDEFKIKNKNIKWTYDNAKHVIWQSEFDKCMTQKWWGEKVGSIIHNGINLKQQKDIHPQLQDFRKKFKKIFVCSASWHRQKRLKEKILIA